MIQPLLHAEQDGHHAERPDPGARDEQADEEAEEAHEHKNCEAEKLTGHDMPAVEGFVHLREEQHQEEDIINVGRGEGDSSCGEGGEKPLHRVII